MLYNTTPHCYTKTVYSVMHNLKCLRKDINLIKPHFLVFNIQIFVTRFFKLKRERLLLNDIKSNVFIDISNRVSFTHTKCRMNECDYYACLQFVTVKNFPTKLQDNDAKNLAL